MCRILKKPPLFTGINLKTPSMYLKIVARPKPSVTVTSSPPIPQKKKPFWFCFKDRFLSGNSGCLGTYCTEHAGLEYTEICPPLPPEIKGMCHCAQLYILKALCFLSCDDARLYSTCEVKWSGISPVSFMIIHKGSLNNSARLSQQLMWF